MNTDEPSKITFESEEWQPSTRPVQSQTPKIVQWVIKYSGGYVKDEKQATYALIGFVVVAVILAFFFVSSGNSGVKGPIPEGTSETVPG